jgi:hypothetical protein
MNKHSIAVGEIGAERISVIAAFQHIPAGRSHLTTSSYGTCLHPKRFQLEHRYFILRSRESQSEHTMNIFYIIGVVVVVLVIAGYFGLHV